MGLCIDISWCLTLCVFCISQAWVQRSASRGRQTDGDQWTQLTPHERASGSQQATSCAKMLTVKIATDVGTHEGEGAKISTQSSLVRSRKATTPCPWGHFPPGTRLPLFRFSAAVHPVTAQALKGQRQVLVCLQMHSLLKVMGGALLHSSKDVCVIQNHKQKNKVNRLNSQYEVLSYYYFFFLSSLVPPTTCLRATTKMSKQVANIEEKLSLPFDRQTCLWSMWIWFYTVQSVQIQSSVPLRINLLKS